MRPPFRTRSRCRPGSAGGGGQLCGPVHEQRRHRAPPVEEARRERAAGQIAVDRHRVGAGRPPDELDPQAVLIAPEAGHRHRRRVEPEDPVSRGGGPAYGGLPVLAALVAAVGRRHGRDVTGRMDARQLRAAELVDRDRPVRQRRAPEPPGRRRHADADDDRVAADEAPVGKLERVHAAGAVDGGDGDAERDVDSLVAVQPGEPLAEPRPEQPQERDRQRLDQRRVAHRRRARWRRPPGR